LREGWFRLGSGLSRIVEGIAAVLLLTVVAYNFLQVIFRYVVISPLGWTEEAMRYSIVWVAYLGSVAALFRGEHMAVDILTMLVPPRIGAALSRIVLACIGLFCLILVWEGFPMAVQDAAQLSPSSEMPMIWPHLSVAVGGLFMLVVVVCLFALPVRSVTARLKDREKS
jgi:TRAP-type C4-dicarboxylate transport system permease small subunit